MVKTKVIPKRKRLTGALVEIRTQQKKTDTCIKKAAIIRYLVYVNYSRKLVT